MRWLGRLRNDIRTENGNMKLIVGLGNPGVKYAGNRHNIGFQSVDRLAETHGLRFNRLQHKARVATGNIGDQRVVLAKPLTYMNLSGQAVVPLLHGYKIPQSNLLVLYDDLDLPLGTIRIRPNGGSGGHKGMQSIIQQLGSEDFPRLRIGIGRPPSGWDSADYVLSNFTPDEQSLLPGIYDRVIAAVETWIREGITVAMNRFNNQGDR